MTNNCSSLTTFSYFPIHEKINKNPILRLHDKQITFFTPIKILKYHLLLECCQFPLRSSSFTSNKSSARVFSLNIIAQPKTKQLNSQSSSTSSPLFATSSRLHCNEASGTPVRIAVFHPSLSRATPKFLFNKLLFGREGKIYISCTSVTHSCVPKSFSRKQLVQ